MTKEPKKKEEAQSDSGPNEEGPGREVWEAQPLSLANTARLIRLLAGQLIQKIILEAPELQGASDTQILTAVLRVLDAESLGEFLSIATDQPLETIQAHYNAAKAIGVGIAFMRLNDMGSILGEARRLGGAGQPRKRGRRRRRSTSKK